MTTLFGYYSLGKTLQVGGMSVLFEGTEDTVGRTVAIKQLMPDLAANEQFIKRFRREAQVMANLRHTNIVDIHHHGKVEGSYYIVMEFVDGHDLRETLKLQSPFPPEIALALLEQICNGLQEAHRNGVIHRDIKPANVLFSRNGVVKITDFGLAKDGSRLTPYAELSLTRPEWVMGTVPYMSPEQATPGADIDHRTDIFSLGVMAYQFLTGHRPYGGDSESEIRANIIECRPAAAPSSRNPVINPEIDQMVLRMLRRDPGERYSSMAEVKEAVVSCMKLLDPGGDLLAQRQEYLQRFAADHRGFTRQLAKHHAEKGMAAKGQGRAEIVSAIWELSYAKQYQSDAQSLDAHLDRLHSLLTPPGSAPHSSSQGTRPYPGVSPLEETITGDQQLLRRPASERWKRLGRMASYGGAIIGICISLFLISQKLLEDPPQEGLAEPARFGALTINGTPQNASVSIRRPGENWGEENQTPWSGDSLQVGEWELRISQQEYETQTKIIQILDNGTSRFDFELHKSKGQLFVTTEPPGATIELRQVTANAEAEPLRGRTPLTTEPIDVGAWSAMVQMKGYIGQRREIEVVRNETILLHFSLASLPPKVATLIVRKFPDEARTVVEQPGVEPIEYQEAGPELRLELEPGTWTVSAFLSNYETQQRTVDLRSGEESTVTLALQSIEPGRLRFRVDPRADVYIDEVLHAGNQSSVDVPLAAGSAHVLRLEHSTYGTYTEKVTLESKATTDLGVIKMFGRLSIVTPNMEFPVEVWIDGNRKGETPYGPVVVGLGTRDIALIRDGFVLGEVTVERDGHAELSRPDGSGDTVFVEVMPGDQLRILASMRSAP